MHGVEIHLLAGGRHVCWSTISILEKIYLVHSKTLRFAATQSSHMKNKKHGMPVCPKFTPVSTKHRGDSSRVECYLCWSSGCRDVCEHISNSLWRPNDIFNDLMQGGREVNNFAAMRRRHHKESHVFTIGRYETAKSLE